MGEEFWDWRREKPNGYEISFYARGKRRGIIKNLKIRRASQVLK